MAGRSGCARGSGRVPASVRGRDRKAPKDALKRRRRDAGASGAKHAKGACPRFRHEREPVERIEPNVVRQGCLGRERVLGTLIARTGMPDRDARQGGRCLGTLRLRRRRQVRVVDSRCGRRRGPVHRRRQGGGRSRRRVRRYQLAEARRVHGARDRRPAGGGMGGDAITAGTITMTGETAAIKSPD